MIAEYQRGFACPQVGLDQSFLELVAVEHAHQTMRTFIDRYGAELRHTASGIVELLTSWLSLDGSFKTIWDPAFGGIYAGLIKEANDAPVRAAAVALRLLECGYPAEWEIRLPFAARFRFSRWLLPSGSVLQVSIGQHAIRIRLQDDEYGTDLCFSRAHGRWELRSSCLEPLPSTTGSGWIVWPAELLQTWELSGLRSDIDDKASPEPLLSGCTEALRVLEDSANLYYKWVTDVIRHLVPWNAEPGQFPSGSSSTNCAPGLIGIGNHRHHLALADSLVHEASHQYCYLTARFGPLDDGDDPELYYNPFLEMKRPIDRILLAYHAFANVALFCRTMRSHGFSDDPYIRNREEYLLRNLPILEEALQGTRALTEIGSALWEPLFERLHE